jgi:hypothetical protein
MPLGYRNSTQHNPIIQSVPEIESMSDELLENMIGDWHITRRFSNRTAENTAQVKWVLQGHWLLITMRDLASPSKYEADVYITKMQETGRYVIHWHDSFGGTVPEVLGEGIRQGDAIAFSFKEKDGELRNTFAWHPESKTWTSHIEQTEAGKPWTVFCTDTYTKK